MAEQNLNFSKIVSTPTPTTWSQAYSAGRLFAAFSLQTETPHQDLEYLAALGKDVISTLESEFFTLEQKDLESIKQAVMAALGKVGADVASSLILCYFAENVLYLFAQGGGKAIIKRAEKIGTVLESDEGIELKTASGYVKDGDLIVLETKPFQRVVQQTTLASSLDKDNPAEITEDLSPQVHEKAEGGAAAVVLNYKQGQFEEAAIPPIGEAAEAQTSEMPETQPSGNPESERVIESTEEIITIDNLDDELPNPITTAEIVASEPGLGKTEINTPPPFLTGEFPRKRRPSFSLPLGSISRFRSLPRQRRTVLAIAGILLILIVIVSVLAIVNRNGNSNQKLFQSVYPQAKGKYDEGENLKDLNSALAESDFKDAKNTIGANINKFPASSAEGKQLSDLLAKVNKEVSSGGGETTNATAVDAKNSKLLSVELDNSSATYFTQNSDYIYFLNGSGVSQIDKGNDKKTEITKKTWKTDGGIGLFGSNVYVLDRADGINKLIPASDGTYANNDYFASDTPDLSSSVDMAIDGSIYVLNKDGSINKYTRGKADTFSISGLSNNLSGATKIFTNSDFDNVYILDNGNSRIVVLDKSGKFVNSYQAAQIKSAKNFDVDEANKKVYILSSGKVYQINLK